MAIRSQLLAVMLLVLTGCASRAYLYSRVIEPATENFKHAPVGSKQCALHGYRLREPVSGYGVSAEWDTKYLKKAALEAGITNVYYADLETLSILYRVYQRRTLIVYGD